MRLDFAKLAAGLFAMVAPPKFWVLFTVAEDVKPPPGLLQVRQNFHGILKYCASCLKDVGQFDRLKINELTQ
jgi:hypothetical protein